jgi:hypothetical protein
MKNNFNNRWRVKLKTYFIFLFIAILSHSVLATDWPQELSGDKGTIVIYQPQPEKLSDDKLIGRAAMQLELKSKDQPIFGVFWFSSTIETDRNNDSVIIKQIKVTNVSWPDSKESAEQQFSEFVEQQLENSSFTSSLSKLTATLASSEKVKKSLDDIKNDAPDILFKDQLAVLLSYDGKPIFKDIDNSPYQRALNTSFAVIKVTGQSQYYLTSGSLWYQASNELGPWEVTDNPPSDLVKMVAKDSVNEAKNKPNKVPDIVTVSKATELVVSDGDPEWVSLTGGELLYVKNTETPWLREIATGDMYLLLSGRWYKSKKEQGTWIFVRGDKLPKSFKDIPPESDIAGLRSSVAGTDEAQQAVLDAQVPQTAAIKRSEAKLTVQYDGEPKFVNIDGTKVDYAVNTGAQVLKISDKYYAVDNGVWFVAFSAKGPWLIADTVPTAAIAEIPPSSPMYNTTYVTVYDSTPEIVYVGYTPGYMWSYPYYGVPIYGTGWYYPPYYGSWYYPRPPTWGLHVGYNPWTGWNAGVSWGGPFVRVGISWGGGYHNHYRGGYHNPYRGGHNTNININGDINIGNSTTIGNRTQVTNNLDNKVGNKLANNSRNNLYNQGNNKKRNAKQAIPSQSIQKAKKMPKRENNVYADKKGNVARNQDGEWQSRSNKNWESVPKQKDKNIKTNSKSLQGQKRSFDHNNMNRDLNSRKMGNRAAAGHKAKGGRSRGR